MSSILFNFTHTEIFSSNCQIDLVKVIVTSIFVTETKREKIGWCYQLVLLLLLNLFNITKYFGKYYQILLFATYVAKLFYQCIRFFGYNKPIL